MRSSNLNITGTKPVFMLIFFALVGFSSVIFGQNNEVTAQQGDGIYRLLTRHGLPVPDCINPFIELNKDRLGKNNTLLAGVTYKLPATGVLPAGNSSGSSTMRFDIFGEKYANVEITSEHLKGSVYYLMSGHGGPDPGAIGKYGSHLLCEDEYAYDVTLRLARNLISYGAIVYMITRDPNDGIRDESFLKPDKDEICYQSLEIPLNQIRRLRQRTNAVNELYKNNKGKFQRMIAIHVDSRSKGENIDVFFYHNKGSNTGEKAAKILQNTFKKKYDLHQPGRGYHGTVSNRNLYVVRNTYPVAVYIELGNINHTRDQQRFIQMSNRQALANWLADGLIADFNTNK
jgi:N-acetylmuramoyl-L-alanine amidase